MCDNIESLVKERLMNVIDIITATGLARSKSEARRLIQQNAVSLDGVKIKEIDHQIEPTEGQVLRVGQRQTVLTGKE